MERLTVNKDVSEMGMYELAHNSCYAKDRNARYRDYDIDIDARELTRKLLKDYADGDDSFIDDENFDDWMMDYLYLKDGMDSIEGLIALFYRNLWAMADLYEKLKYYEDLEEKGKLQRLPCAVGDTVYVKMQFGGYAEAEVRDFTYFLTCGFCIVVTSDKFNKQSIPFYEFGKTVFLTKEEAEATLKELWTSNRLLTNKY